MPNVKMTVTVDYIIADWLIGKMATVEKPASGTFEIIAVETRPDMSVGKGYIIYIRGHHTPWFSQDEFTIEKEL